MKTTTSSHPRSPGRLGVLSGAVAGMLLLGLTSNVRLAHAASAPPERMSYQGYLVDNNAAPLGRPTPINYPITFRIFDEAEGGNRLWSEQQVVTVDNGNFSVILGEGTAIGGEANTASLSGVFAGANADRRYLGIQVTIDGQAVVIQPRLRLLPSPYSFAATQANQLVNPITGQAFLTQSAGTVTIAGTVNATGGITGLTAAQVPSHLTGNRTFTGNVGIGTTTPNYLLSLGSGLGNTKLALYDASATTAYGLGIQTRQFRFHLPQADNHRFSFLDAPDGAELFTINGNGHIGIPGSGAAAGVLELGAGVAGKEASAGKIGYQRLSTDSLDIVGAGTQVANRKVKIYNEGGATFTGPITVPSVSSPKWRISEPIPWKRGFTLPQTGTFTSGGGTLKITVNCSFYRSAVGLGSLKLVLNGGGRGEIEQYHNNANFHLPATRVFVLTGIAAGNHTVEIVNGGNTAVVDANDTLHVIVEELPF